MSVVAEMSITPPDDHVVTAREALEPLYERLELETDRAVLAAAVEAGWPPEDVTKALAALRLNDALATLEQGA